MNELEWRQSLKVGDEVVVRTGYGIPVYQLDTIDKVTPAQVVIGNWRYWIKSGEAVGHSGYSIHRIQQPTQDIRDDVEGRELRTKCRDYQWTRVSLDQLRRIVAILDEGKDTPCS